MKKVTLIVLAVFMLTVGMLVSCGDGAGGGDGGGLGGDPTEWEKYKNGIIKDVPTQIMVESVHLNFINFISRFTDTSTGYYGYNYVSSSSGILLSLHYMDLNEAKADNLRTIIQTHTGTVLKQMNIIKDFNYYEAAYDSAGGKSYYCLYSHYFKGYKASSKLTFPADAGYATLGFSY